MYETNFTTLKEMLQLLKFVLETKEYCIKLAHVLESEEWYMFSFSDSDWSGDPETCISVTGFVIYFLGASVCWRSKHQKGMALSAGKTEYVDMSEAMKETRFIYYLLSGMGVYIKLLIVVRFDNMGTIFMTEKSNLGAHTRHIEIRYHFVLENMIDKIITMDYPKSEENVADIFTKNMEKKFMKDT
jgi:hypothetical protein